MKWRVVLALVLGVGGLVWVLAKSFGNDPHEVPFMLAGKPAPDFKLKRMDNGETVALGQLKGKPVILNFWATWCEPCRGEQPALDAAARSLADQAYFFGVPFEDKEEAIRAWDMQPAYPQLWDEHSQMAVDYGAAGVPETYIVDATGIIRGKFVGPVSEANIVRAIEGLKEPMATTVTRP